MRVVRSNERASFSPPGSNAIVSILVGKNAEQGSFEKHTVAVVKLPAGAKLDQHFHKEREESYLVLSGKGKAIIDGKTIEMRVGDLISVSQGE